MINKISITIVTMAALAIKSTNCVLFSADLRCGKCVSNGYNFCFEGTDSLAYDDSNPPQMICCQDTSCPQATNSSWTCSKSYADQEYALTFCPQRKSKCGENQVEVFEDNVNFTRYVEPWNLADGETCTYMVKALCHAPSFKYTGGRGMAGSTNTYVTFIEYKKSFIYGTAVDTPESETLESRKTKMPSMDKPPRN